VKSEKNGVNDKRCYDRLKDADNSCLLTRLFKLRETELVSDRESDKAKSDVADKRIATNVLHADKAKTLHVEGTEAEGAKQNARDQIGGNGGKLAKLGKAGEEKACQKRNGKTDQGGHTDTSFLPRGDGSNAGYQYFRYIGKNRY
jgi:hypothetical protein